MMKSIVLSKSIESIVQTTVMKPRKVHLQDQHVEVTLLYHRGELLMEVRIVVVTNIAYWQLNRVRPYTYGNRSSVLDLRRRRILALYVKMSLSSN